jgi:hypothetical protein
MRLYALLPPLAFLLRLNLDKACKSFPMLHCPAILQNATRNKLPLCDAVNLVSWGLVRSDWSVLKLI